MSRLNFSLGHSQGVSKNKPKLQETAASFPFLTGHLSEFEE